MNAYTVKENYTLGDLLAADRWARNFYRRKQYIGR